MLAIVLLQETMMWWFPSTYLMILCGAQLLSFLGQWAVTGMKASLFIVCMYILCYHTSGGQSTVYDHWFSPLTNCGSLWWNSGCQVLVAGVFTLQTISLVKTLDFYKVLYWVLSLFIAVAVMKVLCRTACRCLLSAEIKGVHQHTRLLVFPYNTISHLNLTKHLK